MSAFGSDDRQEQARAAADRVQAAEAEVAELQLRVDKERQAFAQLSGNLIASSAHIDIQVPRGGRNSDLLLLLGGGRLTPHRTLHFVLQYTSPPLAMY